MHKRDDIRMLCSSILCCSKFNRCCIYVGTQDTLIMADSDVRVIIGFMIRCTSGCRL